MSHDTSSLINYELCLSAFSKGVGDELQCKIDLRTNGFRNKNANPPSEFNPLDILRSQSRDSRLQFRLTNYIDIVRCQVSRYGRHINIDDLHELYQEGLLTVWELIVLHKDFVPCHKEFEGFVKRKVNTSLKRLRREQWKISKVTKRLLEQETCLVALPKEEAIEAELNKNCLQKALVRLNPKESIAICSKFGIFNDRTFAYKARRTNLSPRSIRRNAIAGLEKLWKDPEVRSLNPYSPRLTYPHTRQ